MSGMIAKTCNQVKAARRAGWIGCNILLRKIPADARIPIVHDGKIRPETPHRQECLCHLENPFRLVFVAQPFLAVLPQAAMEP